MPGFNINGGSGPAANLETRRKHRWNFQTLPGIGQSALLVLQSAQRPNFKFEEPEMHHNQEVAYFAGKQSWEPITLTWYDVEQDPDISSTLYTWLQTVVTITSANVVPPSSYKKQASLQMVDGGGTANETWTIYNCWPKEVNWQDLDYTVTDIATIEAQMRYDRAIRN